MNVDDPSRHAQKYARRARSGRVAVAGVIAVTVVGCSPWSITGVDDGERTTRIVPVVQSDSPVVGCTAGRYLAPAAFTARVMRALVVEAPHRPVETVFTRPSSADPSCSWLLYTSDAAD
ncbi:hypothetical protein EEB19_21910, partial [Gordonia sp. OPL2]